MVRKIIPNHHKIKRRWGRKMKRVKQDLLAPVVPSKSRHDYAWQRSHANPYQRGESNPLRDKIALSLLIVCIISICWFWLFHPAFKVTNIETAGLQRINEQELVNSIKGGLNYKKLFFLPAESYVLTDIDEIREMIEAKFPIESIVVKKNFPSGISITIDEKISTVIYDNGTQYSYLGIDGRVLEVLRNVGEDEWFKETEMVTSTDTETGEEFREEKIAKEWHVPPISNVHSEMGEYPIVYQDKKGVLEINDDVAKERLISAAINWYNVLEKKTDIPYGYIIIENEIGDGVLHTREGWNVLIRLDETVDRQFDQLQTILREKVERPNFQYIDVRYQGRVYWQ
jgi:hypothetical protein